MKIIQFFKTLLHSGSIMPTAIPCYIDYPGASRIDPYFTILLQNKEAVQIHFEKVNPVNKSFQITNAFVFTEEELKQMAEQFQFDLASYPTSPNQHRAVLKSTPSPTSILYAHFYEYQSRDFCTIQQINGHTDYDSNYPLIWRVAEVKLSEEFKQKLDFHWQNKLKTYISANSENS
jgi:hypothetical protein